MRSATTRDPRSQAPPCPLSTAARIWLAPKSFGAALTTLADSALSSSSFHHSGLATSAHASSFSMLKARAVAIAQPPKPIEERSVEAAQRFLEAMERFPVGSEPWGRATASAYMELGQEQCDRMAKPEWWNDEGLKALSARVVRAAPNGVEANFMRAAVLSGYGSWEAGPRSAAELKKAAAHFERAAALSDAPAVKAELADLADGCRSQTER